MNKEKHKKNIIKNSKNTNIMSKKLINFSIANLIFLFIIFFIAACLLKPSSSGKILIIYLNIVGDGPPYKNEYGIHPYLFKKIKLVIDEARAKGINLKVVEGYRTFEKQQRYYEQGRKSRGRIITYVPAGLSYHNYGFAVDVVEFKNGKPNWHSKNWKKIGMIGKKHGLIWGGDWDGFVDRPHFQLSDSDILKHCIF